MLIYLSFFLTNGKPSFFFYWYIHMGSNLTKYTTLLEPLWSEGAEQTQDLLTTLPTAWAWSLLFYLYISCHDKQKHQIIWPLQQKKKTTKTCNKNSYAVNYELHRSPKQSFELHTIINFYSLVLYLIMNIKKPLPKVIIKNKDGQKTLKTDPKIDLLRDLHWNSYIKPRIWQN